MAYNEQHEDMEKEKAYCEEQLQNREIVLRPERFEREKKFHTLIEHGQLEILESLLANILEKDVGKLSKNSFRQQLYEVIIGTALATRAAIRGGVPEDDAYTLSDIYVQKADLATSTQDLWQLYRYMIFDFAKRVKEAKDPDNVSFVVKKTQDFIHKRLHYNVTLKEIAENAGFSENYFSVLFKKETGDSITEFIQKCKMKEAENLLKYSDYSLNEIGQYLGFCSQSHFSHMFKKYAGITPGIFRKKNHLKSWKVE